MIITKELLALIEQCKGKSEVLALLEQHLVEGNSEVTPREGGLLGKDPVLVIVDEFYYGTASHAVLGNCSKAAVTMEVKVADFEKMIATTLAVVEAHVTKEKGPRKRSGGKWKSKWDRWG